MSTGHIKSHTCVTKSTTDYLTGLLNLRRSELIIERRKWEKQKQQPDDYTNLIEDCTRELTSINIALEELT